MDNSKITFTKKDVSVPIIRRDIFFFQCKRCKKGRRQSLKEKMAGEQLCRSCRRMVPDPNQMKLIEE